MGFYDDDYRVPGGTGGYMKLKDGDNKFRILSTPLIGVEYWVDSSGNPRPKNSIPQDGDKPVRVTPETKIPAGANPKFFNAFVVWNYASSAVEVLQVTQKNILNTILVYYHNPEFGDPRGYDIIVRKSGQKLDTEYFTTANPPKPLTDEIKKAYSEKKIDLTALMRGEDPFNPTTKPTAQESVDLSDIPF